MAPVTCLSPSKYNHVPGNTLGCLCVTEVALELSVKMPLDVNYKPKVGLTCLASFQFVLLGQQQEIVFSLHFE